MTNAAKTIQFGSDNYAGICPEALEAMLAANHGHQIAYGHDPHTHEACDAVREIFQTDCEVFFLFTGTAANCLALASICQPHHAAIAHHLGHTYEDECNGPEFFTGGARLLLVEGQNGKLSPDAVETRARARTDLHFARTRAVTFAQATEVGTVYTPAELHALAEVAHRSGLKIHMDGARLANAIATLGVAPPEITSRAGIDVLSFGLTKTGLAMGEAVVFFDRSLAGEFEYRAKQAGQLASKMRFITAPWAAMLRTGAWLHHAAHANAMAQKLEHALRTIPGIEILFPVQANAVFAAIPAAAAKNLRARGWHFHDYPRARGYRFMCAWDTRPEDISALTNDLRNTIGHES